MFKKEQEREGEMDAIYHRYGFTSIALLKVNSTSSIRIDKMAK